MKVETPTIIADMAKGEESMERIHLERTVILPLPHITVNHLLKSKMDIMKKSLTENADSQKEQFDYLEVDRVSRGGGEISECE